MNTAAAAAVKSNPFPGLRPFREEEEYKFFGRENQVDAMVNKLAATHFLAVVGTSGSGKSSLVNCGLRPALHGGLMARAGTAWRMAQFRPGSDPLGALARALAKDGVLFRDYQAGGLTMAEIIDTTLRMSKLGLVDIYEQAQLGQDVNLLVVVDQFEELFRYRQLGAGRQEDVSGIGEAAAFVNLLLEAKAQTTYPIHVVLTMRSDFLGDCAQFTGLAEAINAGQYLVPRMTRDERRAAISGPVGVGGAEIAPVLLTRLVNDVGDNPDQLSILQHALNRTWARWQHEGGGKGPLDLTHYEAIGTMAHALDQHAEKAYAELGSARQQQICEKLFKALTDKATDPRGVRRPTILGTLYALADATEAEVTEVIKVFRQPSRSFLMPPDDEALAAETVIDISHESLMRVWRRLNTWAGEEARLAQTYRRLADTAALHAEGKASLWRDPDLQLALDWRDHSQPNETWASRYHPRFAAAMHFLTQSSEARDAERAEREAQRRRELEAEQEKAEAQARHARHMRWAALFSGALALVAVIVGLIAFDARNDAKENLVEADEARTQAEANQRVAEKNFKKAKAEQLASLAIRLITKDPTKALRVAQAAYEYFKSTEAEPSVALRQAILQAHNEPFYVEMSHEGTVNSALFTRDGTKILSASWDRTARLWDSDGKSLQIFKGHEGPLSSAVFSPDETKILTASWDNTTKLWDVQGNLLVTLTGHTSSVTSALFSPKGDQILTASRDNTAKLWDLNGNELQTLPGHNCDQHGKCGVTSAIFSLQGDHILTASYDKVAWLWDLQGKAVQSFEGHSDAITSVSFSPDGRSVATASKDNTAKVWDVDGTLTATLSGHVDVVRSVRFSPNSKLIVTASDDATARLWTRAGKSLFTLRTENIDVISRAFFSPDGRSVLTLSDDNDAHLWSVDERRRLKTLRGHSGALVSGVFSLRENKIVTAARDKTVKVWNLDGNHILPSIKHEGRRLQAASFSPQGDKILSTNGDTRLWALDGRYLAFEGSSFSAFSPNGDQVITSSSRAPTKIWKLDGTPPVKTFGAQSKPVERTVFTVPDGEFILDDRCRIWDLDDHLITEFDGHKDKTNTMVFSKDGERILTASRDENAILWDRDSRTIQIFKGHTKEVTSADLSPDGEFVFTTSKDETAKLWNLDGRAIRTFREHGCGQNKWGSWKCGINDGAFSPNGRLLVTVGDDGIAILQDLLGTVIGTYTDGRTTDKGWAISVIAVDFSPRGDKILTASHDGLIRLWYTPSGIDDWLQTAPIYALTEADEKEYGITE